MCLVGNKRAELARVVPCENNFCTKYAHHLHFCGLQKLNTLNLRHFHPPLNPCNHFSTVLIKTNWCTISCKYRGCSKLEKATFQGKLPSNIRNCDLQSTCIFIVPKAYLQDYKDALGSKYSYIYASKDSESGEEKPVEQCAVPTILYADGKQLGAAKAINGTASQAVSESVVIAKMGNQTIKIAVK